MEKSREKLCEELVYIPRPGIEIALDNAKYRTTTQDLAKPQYDTERRNLRSVLEGKAREKGRGLNFDEIRRLDYIEQRRSKHINSNGHGRQSYKIPKSLTSSRKGKHPKTI